ncbi:FAD-dependent oxidoreductase [Aquipuribacter nitratireducens]|uniref:FAD-dependent oxidoreductase n=1 Tax=Aquipuribacter nitratireducens TaxID=650104 RepID=A0ABW0GRG6_9MICO
MAATQVCVVGGGPAGMVLGTLLARGGVRVTVLEKHTDFLRDFRGDTVHASTLTLLDELGLGEELARLPQRRVETAEVVLDSGPVRVGDLRRLPGRHRHIALVPQWDFLELLASAAAREPTFSLRRDAEVVGVRRDGGGRVCGVVVRDRTDGATSEVGADLVVACDGRGSTVRAAAGLPTRTFGVPMDVEWFRLPRADSDPSGLVGRISSGRMVVMIDRGGYWQCGFLVRHGGDEELRRQPVDHLRAELERLLPWLRGRTADLAGWDDVSLLAVRLDRLRRWHAPGLLVIGDAAHAMSPVGGVGINLAIQDATAAARHLGEVLRAGDPAPEALDAACRRVQRRRWLPTVLVQAGQRLAHRRIIRRVLGGDAPGASATRPPRALQVLQRLPWLQGVPARLVAIGPLPEHAPPWARR